jgi:ATP-dependent DNA helicase RecG
MNAHLEQLQQWMDADEDEHLEFKEAKSNFHFEKLLKYCAALANEGGGHFILGVTDKKPRRVVGSQAFADLSRTKAGLIERLRLRIDAEEVAHPDGRVVVVAVPSRALGVPVAVEGAYWMRSGEDLAPMTPDMLKRIFEEAEPDFSAEVCPEATLADLDPAAIAQFRSRWLRKSGTASLATIQVEQLLTDAELIAPRGITYAALVLLANPRSLGRFLGQAEVIFEYRSVERAGPASQREEFREGFFVFYDRLWDLINLRNDRQHFQEGFFVNEVPTFSEGSIREAILNAVSHRDYRHPGSVFVRQFRRRIEIVSPGGFPTGITLKNILDQQLPRNRRIAETFARCDLVERAGQGMNRIFEECIRQSKPLPDFSGTDNYSVFLTLRGEIQDPSFLRFLERIGSERLANFNTHDFLILDCIHHDRKVPERSRARLPYLLEQGVIERIARGKFILSRKFYTFVGKPGAYTRKRGLDRDTNKALLLKHIEANSKEGSPIHDLLDVLPSLTREQVKTLLRELKLAGMAYPSGVRRAARWFPGRSGQSVTQEQPELK